MSLAFLFKKGWHTATIRNQERVWLAEQKHEEEQQRIKDLQKQVEEERQLRELQELQGISVNKGDDRIDWMYEGPMQARVQSDEKEAEEYLLGKAFKGKQAGVDEIKAAESRYDVVTDDHVPTIALPSANEVFRRLHEDPLLRMRQAEKVAHDKVVSNPIKMGRIHAEAERIEFERKAAKRLKKEGKKAKRQAKKLKKQAAKRHHKRRHSDSSSSSSSSVSGAELKNKKQKKDTELKVMKTDSRYGLVNGEESKKNENLQYSAKDLAPREDLVAARMLEEKQKREELEERRQRHSHRLSQDEKLRRARDMEEDAVHHEARHQSLLKERHHRVDDSPARKGSSSWAEIPYHERSRASFIREVDKTVIEEVSMGDRIARGRHYQQRDADSYNFMRR